MKNIRFLLFNVILLFPLLMFAQQTVKGTVTETTGGIPLPGVGVIIKGTIIGTATDFDGNYTLENVNTGDILVFSFVGFKTQEITVSSTIINIALVESTEVLDEVIIVGYGVQRKSKVQGSAVRVNGDALKDAPVSSFDAALQGKAAGVQVIQGSGLAGSANVVRVRGISSISAGGDPLYVIDGIPITQDYFLQGDSNGQNNNP